MVLFIDDSTVDRVWSKMTPGLQRALIKTPLSEYWDLPSAYQEIKKGKLFGFYQVESGYSGVFSIGSTPLVNTLYFFWSGKDPRHSTPVDYPEVDSFLLKVAQGLNCKYINCEGRKGWKPLLLPLGYSEDSTIYSKEVTL